MRALFVQCVRNADRLPPVPEFRGLMIRALREAWARPGELTGAAIAVIKGEPTVARGIHAAMASWPRRLSPSEIAQPIGVLVQDDLAARRARQCAGQRYRTGAPADRRAHHPARRRHPGEKRSVARDDHLRGLARAPVLHQRIRVRRLGDGASGVGVAAQLGALRARRPRAGVRDPSPCAGVLRAAARARPRPGHPRRATGSSRSTR